MEKDGALFVAYYYWGYAQSESLWQSFDKLYDLSEKFVNSYSQDKNWEDESFEEYIENFINNNL
jgi:hypothetical protein